MAVTIGFCRNEDIGDVMRFLHEYWANDHILSNNKALMDWQHRERDGRGYSYVLAREDDEGPILGILGFISTRHYDPVLTTANVVDLAIWKVRADIRIAGIGLKLHQFLMRNEPHVAAVSIGIGNHAHRAMYGALGYFSGYFDQRYLLNPDCHDFRLALFPNGPPPSRRLRGDATLTPVTADSIVHVTREMGIGARASMLPFKTSVYFRERFLLHPIYRYKVHAIHSRGQPRGLIASRVSEHAGARALRIVDCLGSSELFAELGPALVGLTQDHNAEYADLWSWGVPDEALSAAGFILRQDNDKVIIPNYFEPFEQSNGRILFAAKPIDGPFVLFRADGDQDRPNRIGMLGS